MSCQDIMVPNGFRFKTTLVLMHGVLYVRLL